MALNSINGLGTVAHMKDHLAFWLQRQSFKVLDPTDQRFIEDALEMALVRVGAEADWRPLQREAEIKSVVKITGTTAVTTQGATAVVDAGATFVTNGVLKHDAYLDSTSEVEYRVSPTPTVETSLPLAGAYGGVSATGVSYTIVRDQFTLADGLWWLRSVQDMTDGQMIPVLSEEDFLSQTSGIMRFGTPRVCMLTTADASDVATSTDVKTNQLLRFWPAPDTADRKYRYRYISLPDLTKTNSEFQPHLQQLVIHAALVDVWQQRGEENKVAFHEAKYRGLVSLFKSRDVNRTHQSNFRMARQFIPGFRDRRFIARFNQNDPVVEP